MHCSVRETMFYSDSTCQQRPKKKWNLLFLCLISETENSLSGNMIYKYSNIAKIIQKELCKILDGFQFYGDYSKSSYWEPQQNSYYVVKILQKDWNPGNMVKQNENRTYWKVCQEIWGMFKRKNRKDVDKWSIKM